MVKKKTKIRDHLPPPCLESSSLSQSGRPYTVVRSCSIYFHLWQEPPGTPHRPDQGHHAVAVHGAVALAAATAGGRQRVEAGGALAVATAAVAVVGDEEGAAALLALLHRAVLVVCVRARVLPAAAALKAEDAAAAVDT